MIKFFNVGTESITKIKGKGTLQSQQILFWEQKLNLIKQSCQQMVSFKDAYQFFFLVTNYKNARKFVSGSLGLGHISHG